MNLHEPISHRKQKLKALYRCIESKEKVIIEALATDFNKSEFEAVVTETAYVLSCIKHTLRHIDQWSKPQRKWPSILNFPSVDRIYFEPYGKVLIIAPWNYPFQLAIAPMIAAIAAGNTVVLKPSELTPTVSSIIRNIIEEVFNPEEVQVIEGGVAPTQNLLQQRWDYIFFTGSVAVGKIVAQAAATHLTPCTLELGGKNPCIISDDTNIRVTAKRLVWGKFINAGQTCIAPDYILVKESIYKELTAALIVEIERAYGVNPKEPPDYTRIINTKNWERLQKFLKDGELLYGGDCDENSRYMGPTLLGNPTKNSKVMQDEIFGPILPIISYTNESEIHDWISTYEKPLAFYVFSNNLSWAKSLFKRYSFGGGCINDTIIHFNNSRLPFGGVGNSGYGTYHGRWGFETFSHRKACVYKPFSMDIPLRYAPYKNKLKCIKKVFKLFQF